MKEELKNECLSFNAVLTATTNDWSGKVEMSLKTLEMKEDELLKIKNEVFEKQLEKEIKDSIKLIVDICDYTDVVYIRRMIIEYLKNKE